MNVNKEDLNFLKQNRDSLIQLFDNRLEELKEQVCRMPGNTAEEREARDRVHLLIGELDAWKNILKQLAEQKKEDKNKDFI